MFYSTILQYTTVLKMTTINFVKLRYIHTVRYSYVHTVRIHNTKAPRRLSQGLLTNLSAPLLAKAATSATSNDMIVFLDCTLNFDNNNYQ